MTADSYLQEAAADIGKIVPRHAEELTRHAAELKAAYQSTHAKMLASLQTAKNPLSVVTDYMTAVQHRQEEIQAAQKNPGTGILHGMSYRASNALREYEVRLTQDFIRDTIAVRYKHEAALGKQLEARDIRTYNVVDEPVAATPAAPWINTVPTEIIEIDADSFAHPVLRTPLAARVQDVEDVGSVNAEAEHAVYRVVDAIPDKPIPQPHVPDDLLTSRWGPTALDRRTQAIDGAQRATKVEDLPAFLEKTLKTEHRATMVELTARHTAGTLRDPDTQFVFDYSEFLKRQIKVVERRIEAATPVPQAERWSYQDMTDRLDKIEDALKIKSGDELFVFTRDILMPEYKAAKAEMLIRVAAGTDKTADGNALADYGVSLLHAITNAKAKLTPAATRVEEFHERMAKQEAAAATPSLFQRATSAVSGWFKKAQPEPAVTLAPQDPLPEPAKIHLAVASLAMRDQLAAEGLAPKSRWAKFTEATSSFGRLAKGLTEKAADSIGNRVSQAVHWTSERAAPVSLGVAIAAAGGVAALAPKGPDVTSLADQVVAQQRVDAAKARAATTEDSGRSVTGTLTIEAAPAAPAPIIVVTEGAPPASTAGTITVARADTKPAKASFAAATATTATFKPTTSLSYTFKDGTESRFSAETWKKVCDQLDKTGTSSTVCDEPGLKNG